MIRVFPAFSCRLVGVTHAPGYPATLHTMVTGLASGPVPARLDRDPTNPVGPNAVAVSVGSNRVGWIPAGVAARLAPAIDAGHPYTAEITEAVVHPAHPTNPGITVRCTLKETATCA